MALPPRPTDSAPVPPPAGFVVATTSALPTSRPISIRLVPDLRGAENSQRSPPPPSAAGVSFSFPPPPPPSAAGVTFSFPPRSLRTTGWHRVGRRGRLEPAIEVDEEESPGATGPRFQPGPVAPSPPPIDAAAEATPQLRADILPQAPYPSVDDDAFDEGFSFDQLDRTVAQMRLLVPDARRRLRIEVGLDAAPTSRRRVLCFDLFEVYRWLRTNPNALLEGPFGRCALAPTQRDEIVHRAESLLSPSHHLSQSPTYAFYEPSREELLAAAGVEEYPARIAMHQVEQNDLDGLEMGSRYWLSELDGHERCDLACRCAMRGRVQALRRLVSLGLLRGDRVELSMRLAAVETVMRKCDDSALYVLLEATLPRSTRKVMRNALASSVANHDRSRERLRGVYDAAIERGEEWVLSWLVERTGVMPSNDHVRRALAANHDELATYAADRAPKPTSLAQTILVEAVLCALREPSPGLVANMARAYARWMTAGEQRRALRALRARPVGDLAPDDPAHVYAPVLQAIFVTEGCYESGARDDAGDQTPPMSMPPEPAASLDMLPPLAEEEEPEYEGMPDLEDVVVEPDRQRRRTAPPPPLPDIDEEEPVEFFGASDPDEEVRGLLSAIAEEYRQEEHQHEL